MIWYIIISLVWHVLRVNADCLYPDLGAQIAYLEPYRPDGYDDFETVYIYCNETIPYVAQASICLFGTWIPEFPTEICNDPCQVPVADGMTYSRLSGHTDGAIFTHSSRISFTCEAGDLGTATSTCNDGVWETPVLCPETSTTYLTTLFVSPAQASTNGRTGRTELLTIQPQPSITSGAPISRSTVDHSTTTEREGTDDISTKSLLASTPATTAFDIFTTLSISSESIVDQQTTELQPSITSDAPISHSTVDHSTTTERAGTDDISTKSLLTSTPATTTFDIFTTLSISSESIVDQQTTELQPSITSDAPISYLTFYLSTTTTDTNTDHTSDGFTSKQITSMPFSSSNDMFSNSPMEAVSTLSPVTDVTETNSASTEQEGEDDTSTKPLLTSTAATTAFDSFTTPFLSSESIVEQQTTEPTESFTQPTKYSTTTTDYPSSAPTIGNTVDGATDQPKVTSETVAATQKTPYMFHTITMQRHTETLSTDRSTSDISHQGTEIATGEPTSHVLDNTFSTTGTLRTSLGTLSSGATSFESITTEAVKEEPSSDLSHTEISDATPQYDTSTSTDYFRETSTNIGTFVSLHQYIGTTGLVHKPSLASSDPTFETSTTIGQSSSEVPTEDATTAEIYRPTTGIIEGATTTPTEETKRSTTVKRATVGQQMTTQGPETPTNWWVIFLGSVGAASLFLLLASCTGFIFAMVFKERRKKDHKMFEPSDSSASGSLELNVTYNPGATTIEDSEDPATLHYYFDINA